MPISSHFSFPHRSPTPGNHESAFCLCGLIWALHLKWIIQYLPFCAWLLLLSIMFSKSLHAWNNTVWSTLFTLGDMHALPLEAAVLLLHARKCRIKHFCYPVLAGVAQWIERQPENQRVTNLILSQGTCLGFRPCQVSSRGRARGNHTLMFLSSPSLPLCLK